MKSWARRHWRFLCSLFCAGAFGMSLVDVPLVQALGIFLAASGWCWFSMIEERHSAKTILIDNSRCAGSGGGQPPEPWFGEGGGGGGRSSGAGRTTTIKMHGETFTLKQVREAMNGIDHGPIV